VNAKKRCRFCKSYKLTDDMTVVNGGFFCDMDCIVDYGMKNRAKGKQKMHREQKRALKDNDKPYRFKQAQSAFNAFVRERDKLLPCISCQRHHTGQYHAGHYKSTGARSDIRFNEDNCHKQCAPCNNHLSGNIGEYLPNLIKKIGQHRVDILDYTLITKYTCLQLLEIEKEYKLKLKALL